MSNGNRDEFDRDNREDRDRDRDRNRAEDRDRDTRIPRDYYDRPTAISLFLRLGYDVTNNEDVQRLATDLRWASEKRKNENEQKPHQLALIGSGFIAVISVALTVLGQWIVAKLTGKPG
jgi:hypothetical protein